LAEIKTSLVYTWLKDKSLADLDNLPDPDVLAEEIAEDLQLVLTKLKELFEMVVPPAK
jgi:type I restriction enzyme M protein